jgi:hypothetical protein
VLVAATFVALSGLPGGRLLTLALLAFAVAAGLRARLRHRRHHHGDGPRGPRSTTTMDDFVDP